MANTLHWMVQCSIVVVITEYRLCLSLFMCVFSQDAWMWRVFYVQLIHPPQSATTAGLHAAALAGSYR